MILILIFAGDGYMYIDQDEGLVLSTYNENQNHITMLI